MSRTGKRRKIGRYILLFLVALFVGRKLLFRPHPEGFPPKKEVVVAKTKTQKAAVQPTDTAKPKEATSEMDTTSDISELISLYPRIKQVFVERRGDTLFLQGGRLVRLGSGDYLRKLALLDTLLAMGTEFKSLDFRFKDIAILR